METVTKINFVLTRAPREREEMFPMQEQGIGAVTIRTLRLAQGNAERPAADVFAERLAEAVAGAVSPSFIP